MRADFALDEFQCNCVAFHKCKTKRLGWMIGTRRHTWYPGGPGIEDGHPDWEFSKHRQFLPVCAVDGILKLATTACFDIIPSSSLIIIVIFDVMTYNVGYEVEKASLNRVRNTEHDLKETRIPSKGSWHRALRSVNRTHCVEQIGSSREVGTPAWNPVPDTNFSSCPLKHRKVGYIHIRFIPTGRTQCPCQKVHATQPLKPRNAFK